jgi:hypothetical protein
MAVEQRNQSRGNLFTEHPHSLGMSWATHGAGAAKIGFELLVVAGACFVHAIVPGWFTETAGRKIVDLSDHIKKRRMGAKNPEQWSDYDI